MNRVNYCFSHCHCKVENSKLCELYMQTLFGTNTVLGTNMVFGAKKCWTVSPHTYRGFSFITLAIFAANSCPACQPNMMQIHSNIVANLHCIVYVKACVWVICPIGKHSLHNCSLVSLSASILWLLYLSSALGYMVDTSDFMYGIYVHIYAPDLPIKYIAVHGHICF